MTNAPPPMPDPLPCQCFVVPRHVSCPVHGLDRSQTTEHPSRQAKASGRVVNTTDSLRKS